jgi:hypothetical protein
LNRILPVYNGHHFPVALSEFTAQWLLLTP